VIFPTLEPGDRQENSAIKVAIVDKILENPTGSATLQPMAVQLSFAVLVMSKE
jgi:hypothetical protein